MTEVFQDAVAGCLAAADADEKCDAVAALDERTRSGELHASGAGAWLAVPVGRPPRPRLVDPARVTRRRLGSALGHAALIHAVAHIEFNAINLALDALHRFRGLPSAYYRDWLQVAAEEARHFALLREHLRGLGHEYGDFDAHDGLWTMAVDTGHDALVRMALVPRVLEARGLDVTPDMMRRLRDAGDRRGADILQIILRDEVGHVAIGSRWFHHLCDRRRRDPRQTFRRLVDHYLRGRPRGPFNTEARRQAGFSDEELAWLQDGLA